MPTETLPNSTNNLSKTMKEGHGELAYKHHYTWGQIKSGIKVGSQLCGKPAGRGYPLGEIDYEGGIGGKKARITRMDGETGGAVLLLQGGGSKLWDFDAFGRRCIELHKPIGTKAKYGIALEGRETPATGKHDVRNVCIAECENGIAFLAGYETENGVWVDAEGHADESEWQHVMLWNCDVGVLSENQQAVNHRYRIQYMNSKGVVFKTKRGGSSRAFVEINCPECTLDELYDFSPNNANIEREIYRDNFPATVKQRLTLVDFKGTAETWKKWRIRLTGEVHAPWGEELNGKLAIDPAELMRLNGLPGENILIDIQGLPDSWLKQWNRVGPWYQMVRKT